MELIEIVDQQIAESEAALLEARDRLSFVNGWNAACREIKKRALEQKAKEPEA